MEKGDLDKGKLNQIVQSVKDQTGTRTIQPTNADS